MNLGGIKNLIIIVNNRRYDPGNFIDIARRITFRASDIKPHVVGAGSSSFIVPPEVWRHPTLTVALDPLQNCRPLRGRLVIGKLIEKMEQLEIMKRAGVRVPLSKPFEIGMDLDPKEWGEFVLLKPIPLKLSSHGKGVQLFRTSKLRGMGLDDFHKDHLVRKHPMIVQKFVNTGEHPCKYRALIFCGEVLYIQHTVLGTRRPALNSSDEELENAQVATGGGERTYSHGNYPDVLAFAKRISAAFADTPLLGCDIVKDIDSGKLRALEVNPGGNVWHFSSRMWAERRKKLPDVVKAMHSQFGAFNVAAQALINTTRRLAT
jgi:hypothetical protein